MRTDETTQAAALPVWARKDTVQRLTGCPDKWLYGFAATHRDDIRKFGHGGRNGVLIFRVSAVLEAIESRDGFGEEVS